MKITITNQIDMGGDTELIHEEYQGELTVKGDYHYLVYTNDDKEKVVLKFKTTELTMTRFSNPQSHMRFAANDLALCSVPTPMGVQKLVTKTSWFALAGNEVSLRYDLLPHAEAETGLASYDMTIRWEELA